MSVSLSWSPSTDDVGVVGYRIYENGGAVGTSLAPPFTVTGLSCGTTYTFGVAAYDGDGNLSSPVNVSWSTPPCPARQSSGAAPQPALTGDDHHPATTPSGTDARSDLLPPSAPLGLGIGGVDASTSAVSLSWTASSDNVGVAGYEIYSDGIRVGATASTAFTVRNLACGTTHTFEVAAYDAAGNRSTRTAITGSTPPCSPTPVPAGGELFVSPGGSDGNACTQAAPCASLNRAYRAASPGQTVEIAAGSYPYQRIAYDPTKIGSARVVFRPATGAGVSISQVDLGQGQALIPGPQHVALQDLGVGYLAVWDGSQDISLENITGRSFDVLSYNGTSYGPARDISITGGDFGPCQAPRDGACTIRLIGDNISVDGTTIHDSTSTDLVNYHVDGIFIRGCSSCSVRNSRFESNMITNIRLQNCCGLPSNQNVSLVGNYFGTPLDGSGQATRQDGIDVDNPVPGLAITDNAFDRGFIQWSTSGCDTCLGNQGGAIVQRNLMTADGCAPGVSYGGNQTRKVSDLFRTTACTGDQLVTDAEYDALIARWTAGSNPRLLRSP